MKNLTLAVPLVALLLLQAQHIHAAPIFLVQQWNADPLIESIGVVTAQTTGSWDDAAVTGIGTEDILLDRFSLLVFANGIGQNFALTEFPGQRTDPATGQFLEGNIFARYINGIYSRLGSVDNGGSAAVALYNFPLTPLVDSGIRVIVNGPNMLEGRSLCCFERDYVLVSETFPNQSVPEPATLILMSLGFLGLGFSRRKCPKN